LAEASANGWNQASLPKLTAEHITSRTTSSTDLFPETENLSCRYLNQMQAKAGFAQVLYLAELQRVFYLAFSRPQKRTGFRQKDWVMCL